MTGSGFCYPGGGSVVGIQIDDGTMTGPGTAVPADPTIWQVVEAAPDGTFLVSVTLPEPSETDPEFTDGSHRLRLVTGPLRAGDTDRQVETGEFVVLAGSSAGTLPEPSSSPKPPTLRRLVTHSAGGVTSTRTGTAVRVVVPDLEPGDWVFPYAISGRRSGDVATAASWVQLDRDRSAVFELDGAPTDVKATRVSVQARDGSVVGWASLRSTQTGLQAAPAAPHSAGEADSSAPVPDRQPRPLVLAAAGASLLLGLVLLVDSRRRKRRRTAALNQRTWF